MSEKKFDPSPAMQRFLQAELANEDEGGIRPTTLYSALWSLLQMPEEVPPVRDTLLVEFGRLIERLGASFEVEYPLSHHEDA